MRFGRMAVRFFRVLGAAGVVTLAMMLSRGAVRLGRLLVVLGGFGMRSFRH